MSEPLLELRDAQVRHGDRAVLDVPSLVVELNETLAIIGPNGAGKSTLLQVLALLSPRLDSGSLLVRGEAVDREHHALWYRRRIAVVFQEPLLCDASVFDNVAMGLRFRGMRNARIAPRVDQWLEQFGIAALRERPARSLSGGEAQRVSLARAFAVEPEVLLLDEPFSALDAPTRAQLVEDLASILSAARTTTVFVTHHRGEALSLGDRVAVLVDGRIQQLDTPAAVFNAPVNEVVARFVGMETILPACIAGKVNDVLKVKVNDYSMSVLGFGGIEPTGNQVLVCLRPEDVILTTCEEEPTAPQPGGSALELMNRLSGRVTSLAPFGGQFRVKVDCGFPVIALVNRQPVLNDSLAVGAEINLSFPASAVHLIPTS